jgi:hypothetical protein
MRIGSKALVAIAALLLGQAGASAAEDVEVELFSVAKGHGAVIPIAENAVQFVGTVQGGLYLQGDDGPLHAGNLVCSVSLKINVEDREQHGTGNCTMTSKDGGAVFGEWQCSGHFLTGCSGPFKVTGGAERFKGATGEGPITLRSAVGTIAASPREASSRLELEGIVFWRKLTLRTP